MFADFFLKQREKNLTGKNSLMTDIIFPDSFGSGKKTARDLGVNPWIRKKILNGFTTIF